MKLIWKLKVRKRRVAFVTLFNRIVGKVIVAIRAAGFLQ